MNKKTYKFSYGGTIKKFISKIMFLFLNLFIVLFLLVLFAFVFSRINYELENFTFDVKILNVIKYMELALIVIISLFFIVQSFLPQKVEIQGNTIKVRRHCLIDFHRGFNDKISIDNIEKICIEQDRCLGNIPRIVPVAIIDWDNLVKIEMESGILLYYIPVQNSDEFIKEVNARIRINKVFEKYRINSVLNEKGIKPEDLKVRWKSQDEIEQIYYNDKNGNKIEIPLLNE